MRKRRKPEVLAPAGDWDALRAAVANGADAVYFGLARFNARHRATNFSLDELPQVMAFLHQANVSGFVTLNTLIFSEELAEVAELVRHCVAAQVDAVIVQDLGLARLIQRLVPTLPIHASTQMTLTERRGIAFAQQQLGIQRVVLPRELSLDEIRQVTARTDVPVEVFVHGALCVAYSGQCLTSEALGGRSANRGQCAQACRLPYEMLVDGQPRDLGGRAYLLSPQDLAAYEHIAPLIEAGVASFKIEGRLKSGPYVAATTQTYRQAVDAAWGGQGFQLDTRQRLELEQTFSRGLTPGFLEGVDHQRLVQGRFPKSRGVRVGVVVGKSRRGIRVEVAGEPIDWWIKPGDGVVFDEGRPEEQEQGGRVREVHRLREAGAKPIVELSFSADDVDRTRIPLGAIVWKTDDPVLRKKLEATYSREVRYHRQPITMTLFGELGGSLTLQVRDLHGRSSSATWPGPLEVARHQPMPHDEIRQQLGRLGDTPFALAQVETRLPPNVWLPRSVLNDLRRQAIDALLAQQAQQRQRSVVDPDALAHLRTEMHTHWGPPRANEDAVQMHVLVRTLEQLDAVLAWRSATALLAPAWVLCDWEDPRRYREAVARARAANMPIAVATLRIQKPGEEGFLRLVANAAPDAVLVRNLAGWSFLREHAPGLPLWGDFSLNIANELTADLLMRQGFRSLVPSYDLSWEQLVALVRASRPQWYEVVIHQHMPMFHMEHCVFAAFLSQGKDFRDCGRPCDRHRVELRDRVGAEFPVLPDAGCRNTVYNSVPQSAAEYVGRMKDLGLRRFRIELLRETPQQIGRLLEHYARVLVGQDDGRSTWRQLQALNQLGVTRGTLHLV